MPDVVETLRQLIDVVDALFIHPLLHDAPDLVVNGIQVWTVGQPEVRTNEVRRLSLQQLDGITGVMCTAGDVVKSKNCWKTNISPATCLMAGIICLDSKTSR